MRGGVIGEDHAAVLSVAVRGILVGCSATLVAPTLTLSVALTLALSAAHCFLRTRNATSAQLLACRQASHPIFPMCHTPLSPAITACFTPIP